jgi:hypothetical protein
MIHGFLFGLGLIAAFLVVANIRTVAHTVAMCVLWVGGFFAVIWGLAAINSSAPALIPLVMLTVLGVGYSYLAYQFMAAAIVVPAMRLAAQPDSRTRLIGHCILVALGLTIGVLIVFVIFELAHNWQTHRPWELY